MLVAVGSLFRSLPAALRAGRHPPPKAPVAEEATSPAPLAAVVAPTPSDTVVASVPLAAATDAPAHRLASSRERALPLPSELVLAVVSPLPVESATALALTSRALYNQFMPASPPHLSPEGRRQVLLGLERDTPHLYLCYRCDKLHTWSRGDDSDRPTTTTTAGIARCDRHCRHRDERQFPRPPHESYNLDFATAKLVMSRHFHGPGHGPTPDDALSFAGTGPASREPNGVMLQRSWRARIIDDELYLEAVVHLYHEQGCARELRDFLDDNRPKGEAEKLVCHHVGVQQCRGWTPRRQHLFEVDRPHCRSVQLFSPVVGSVKSCKYCLTDYRVDIERRPGDAEGPKGWVITATRWHRLGDCRSPDGRMWRCYADVDCKEVRPAGVGVGAVYREWMKHDAVGGEKAEMVGGDVRAGLWLSAVRDIMTRWKPRYIFGF